MLLFHHKNKISPANVSGSNLYARTLLRSGRANLILAEVLENLLRSQTAPLIATANKQNFTFKTARHIQNLSTVLRETLYLGSYNMIMLLHIADLHPSYIVRQI